MKALRPTLAVLAALSASACKPSPPPAFSCETAAAALGQPTATVVACDPLPGLPNVVQVALKDDKGATSSLTVVVRDGHPATAQGGAALQAYLDALSPDRRDHLTMADINGLLRAFSAFPEPFGPRDWNFDMPDIGRSTFTPSPFSLLLFASVPPPPDHPEAMPATFRATLAPGAGGYVWTIEQRTDAGAWVPQGVVPLGGATP